MANWRRLARRKEREHPIKPTCKVRWAEALQCWNPCLKIKFIMVVVRQPQAEAVTAAPAVHCSAAPLHLLQPPCLHPYPHLIVRPPFSHRRRAYAPLESRG